MMQAAPCADTQSPTASTSGGEHPTGSISGGQHPTANMQCFEIGVEAAGLVNTDPAVHYVSGGQHPTDNMQCFEIGVEAAGLINTDPTVHYAKFQIFIRGEEPGDDLWIGLMPIHIMANPEVIHSYSLLFRAIGAITPATPYVCYLHCPSLDQQTFIRSMLTV